MRTRRLIVGVAVVGAVAGLAFGQEQGGKEAGAGGTYTKGTVLVVDYSAPALMFPDQKDRALVEALSMVPSRVKELPREVEDMPPEAASALNTVMRVIGKPGRLTIAYDGEMPSGGLFGYGVSLSFLMGDQKATEEIHGTVSSLMAESGQRIKTTGTRWKGMSDIQAGVGVLSFGPREAKDGWRYEVVFGTMNDADGAVQVLPTTKDFEAVVRARMDFAGLTPLKEAAMQFAGQEMVGEIFDGVEQMGLVGPEAVKINYLAGYTKDESVSYSTWEGAKKYASQLQMASKPLTEADYKAVPADATEVYIARMGEDGFGYLIEMMGAGEEMVEAGLEEFQNHTGVNLKTDLLEALGGTGIMYMSDTTGGGGVLSAVGMISFRDREKVTSAINKLIGVANAHADENPLGPGYIRLVSWKEGESDMLTLRFPGLPVPLELTIAMTKDWFIVSPTIQGTIAAARQVSGKGDGGLMTNAAFSGRLPRGKELLSASFIDTARTMREGYWVTSLVGSAIANGVRSASAPGRDPGLVVPLYHDLRKDVKAGVMYSYWKGEDLVTESRGDRSVLVQVSGVMGTLQKFLPLIGVAAAAGAAEEFSQLGPVDGAREFARTAMRAFPIWAKGPVAIAGAHVPRRAVRELREHIPELQGSR